ncbi:MAG TPA: deoxyuridine 5'-triphosphate nucleotidohydrolase [Candidatus Limnocylindria bacterium]|nr:deoxyuridine 5'-triphosphate nucleotidohydrolase [Candidatus Limnocylindria bacterium]
MTVLSREDLRAALSAAAPIVEGAAAEALQPNGIDLSVERVARLGGAGALGVEARDQAARVDLEPDRDGWWTLAPGAYVIGYAERVNLPNDVMALGRPRSSLLRSGVTVYTAVWDAGYSGRGEGALHVMNEHGWRVQRGARVVQLVFFRLARAAAEGYRGRYQGEGA